MTGRRAGRPAQKGPPSPEPGDQVLGRSRGELTTKFQLAAEQGQKPLAVIVTAGQRGDSPQFISVLEKISVSRPHGGRTRTRPDCILGGKAYGSRANRGYLPGRGRAAQAQAPGLRPREVQAAHAVECVNRLKGNRAVATRYEKLAVRYEATIHVASIGEWLRPLTS